MAAVSNTIPKNTFFIFSPRAIKTIAYIFYKALFYSTRGLSFIFYTKFRLT